MLDNNLAFSEGGITRIPTHDPVRCSAVSPRFWPFQDCIRWHRFKTIHISSPRPNQPHRVSPHHSNLRLARTHLALWLLVVGPVRFNVGQESPCVFDRILPL